MASSVSADKAETPRRLSSSFVASFASFTSSTRQSTTLDAPVGECSIPVAPPREGRDSRGSLPRAAGQCAAGRLRRELRAEGHRSHAGRRIRHPTAAVLGCAGSRIELHTPSRSRADCKESASQCTHPRPLRCTRCTRCTRIRSRSWHRRIRRVPCTGLGPRIGSTAPLALCAAVHGAAGRARGIRRSARADARRRAPGAVAAVGRAAGSARSGGGRPDAAPTNPAAAHLSGQRAPIDRPCCLAAHLALRRLAVGGRVAASRALGRREADAMVVLFPAQPAGQTEGTSTPTTTTNEGCQSLPTIARPYAQKRENPSVPSGRGAAPRAAISTRAVAR